MEPYTPIFTITPEILTSAYEIATDFRIKQTSFPPHSKNKTTSVASK